MNINFVNKPGRKSIGEALANPDFAWQYVKSIIKGKYYKLKYGLRTNIKIGKNLRVNGKLVIRGPGKVIIGNNVIIGMRVTPWTCSKDAKIIIADNVFLNGARFSCAKKIEIGESSIIAECRIMDYDFHSTVPENRHNPEYIGVSPIKIGKNVWITVDCVILKGVTIGDDSTITPSSVVITDVPSRCIFGGNPSKIIKTIK